MNTLASKETQAAYIAYLRRHIEGSERRLEALKGSLAKALKDEGGEELKLPCPRCGKLFLYPSYSHSMKGALSYCSDKCMNGIEG